MPFAMGPFELIVILVIVVLVFGVGRLPEVGSALGKGIREFRNATTIEDEVAKKDVPSSEGDESPSAKA